VDLGRQILTLVLDHQPAGTIPISSANGDTYTSWNGTTVTARTPEGSFSFYREEKGWYRSYLGGLYHPFFFRGGYAIHGSNSVPAYPASHGCIRTQIADQNWLSPQIAVGMPVFVYGYRTEAPAV
jgi:lipoprotein-anchoring transpeptidase ErfK/SrfK